MSPRGRRNAPGQVAQVTAHNVARGMSHPTYLGQTGPEGGQRWGTQRMKETPRVRQKRPPPTQSTHEYRHFLNDFKSQENVKTVSRIAQVASREPRFAFERFRRSGYLLAFQVCFQSVLPPSRLYEPSRSRFPTEVQEPRTKERQVGNNHLRENVRNENGKSARSGQLPVILRLSSFGQ